MFQDLAEAISRYAARADARYDIVSLSSPRATIRACATSAGTSIRMTESGRGSIRMIHCRRRPCGRPRTERRTSWQAKCRSMTVAPGNTKARAWAMRTFTDRTNDSSRFAHVGDSAVPNRDAIRDIQRRPAGLRKSWARPPWSRIPATSAFAAVVLPAPSIPNNTTVLRRNNVLDEALGRNVFEVVAAQALCAVRNKGKGLRWCLVGLSMYVPTNKRTDSMQENGCGFAMKGLEGVCGHQGSPMFVAARGAYPWLSLFLDGGCAKGCNPRADPVQWQAGRRQDGVRCLPAAVAARQRRLKIAARQGGKVLPRVRKIVADRTAPQGTTG